MTPRRRHVEACRATGTVRGVVSARPGAQELLVQLDGPTSDPITSDARSSHDAVRPATNLTTLCGPAQVGDRVIVNTVALDLQLGSGGHDFVVAVTNRSTSPEIADGHVLKLRYTPLQVPVLAVDAPECSYHRELASFDSLDNLPVVCAELHSQIPAICAAARWALRERASSRPVRIAYVMTDGASLPMAVSRLVPAMRTAGLVDCVITAGQAFGGDYEAVNLYSALAAASRIATADIVVVGQGPGNVGTNTPLGFSGIEQGVAINAAASLGGTPIAVARISFADRRRRHHGLSHHTYTVLSRVAMTRAYVPVPRLPAPQMARLHSDLAPIAADHEVITVDADQGLCALDSEDIAVTTMGRGLSDDRAFFLSAAAAGLVAAQIAESRSWGTPAGPSAIPTSVTS